MGAMIFSPEFHRNLWLRITALKVALVPVLVGLGVYMVMEGKGADPFAKLLWPAMIAYVVIVILLGSYEAAGAFVEEAKEKTWDFQRMSGASPWGLIFGKLFGVTSYIWLFGIMLLGVMAYSYGRAAFTYVPKGGNIIINYRADFGTVYLALCMAVLTAVAGHLTALLVSLMNMRMGRFSHVGGFVAGAFVGVMALKEAMAGRFVLPGGERLIAGMQGPTQIEWWGMAVEARFFILCSLLFLIYWLIVGVYRTMREELQFKNTPVAWGAFCLAGVGYFMGLREPGSNIWGAGCFILLAASFLIMTQEVYDLTRYKRFIQSYQAADIKGMFENSTRWAVSFALALLFFVVASFVHIEKGRDYTDIILVLGIMLFLVRDGLVWHALLLGRSYMRSRRFMLVVYYLCVYVFVPFVVLNIVGQGGAPWKEMDIWAALFYPVKREGGEAFMIIFIVLECFAAGWFLKKSLEKLR